MSDSKNSRFLAEKLRLGIVAPLLLAVSIIIQGAGNLASASPFEGPLTACDKERRVLLPLPLTFDRAAIESAHVLCAFRSKITGFPTLTVVQTTPPPAAEMRSNASKMASLEESYRSVGLSNVRASLVEEQYSGGTPGYLAAVSFESETGSMEALVAIFELPDRSYIVTLQDHAESLRESKDSLLAILRGIALAEANHERGDEQTRKTWPWDYRNTTILGTIGATAIALLAILLARIVRRRRLR
jgi:hypothetical protein